MTDEDIKKIRKRYHRDTMLQLKAEEGAMSDWNRLGKESGLLRTGDSARMYSQDSFFYQHMATTEQRAEIDEAIGDSAGYEALGMPIIWENVAQDFIDNVDKHLGN